MVVGGGLAGITAALALADAGVRRHAARRPAAPGRARLLLPARRTSPSTTASTCTCVAAPPTAGSSTGSTAPRSPRCRTGSTYPSLDVGGAGRAAPGPTPARPRCPYRCTSARSLATLPAPLARRARQRRAVPHSRSRRSTRPTRRWTRSDFGSWLAAHGQSRARRRGTVGPGGGRHPQRASPGTPRWGSPRWCSRPVCCPSPGAADIGWAARPARRPARHSGPQGARLRGRAYRTPYHASPPSTSSRGRALDRIGSAARRSTPTPSCSPCRSARRTTCCPTGALDDARPAAATSAPHRSSTCMSSTTARCCARPFFAALGTPGAVGLRPDRGVRARRRRPVPGAVAVGRARRDRRARRRAARAVSAGAGAAAARARAAPTYGTSSSPGSGPRRSPPPPASDGCGPAPVPERPACTWPVRGPPPAGPRPWRVRSAAASARPVPRWAPWAGPATTSSTWRRQPDARSSARGRSSHPRTATRGETVPTVPPAPNSRRRGGRDRAPGARPDPGHAGTAGGRRPARAAHGHRRRLPLRLDRRRRAGPRPATAARPYAPRSPCCPPRSPAPPAEVGIPGAVAVELVHNFSLLHDDLMDGDEQRRHRDTVWKVHGPAQAILVGDALFALANEVLLELGTVEAGRATRRLTTATRKLIDGQAQDISYEHRERVTVEECLEMEGNKTGALLACAVSIGAVLGGARRPHRRHPGDVRLPPRPRLPGRRRPARHLGRPGGHRQADLERPAPAQEVPARRRRARRGRPGRRAARRTPRRRREEQRLRQLLRGGVRRPRRPDRGGGRPRVDRRRRRAGSTPSPSTRWTPSTCPTGCGRSSPRSPTSSSYERDDHYRSNKPRESPAGAASSGAPADGGPAQQRHPLHEGEAMTATTDGSTGARPPPRSLGQRPEPTPTTPR